MRLYSGHTKEFLEDIRYNLIADKLNSSFLHQIGHKPSPQEVNSWRNSLRAFSSVVEEADLLDHGIILEYQIPMTSYRLDCMLTGLNSVGEPSAVVTELKQWTNADVSETEECMDIPGYAQPQLHPSKQVGNYVEYLSDFYTVFYDNGFNISGLSYLHNALYTLHPQYTDDSFGALLDEFPLFYGDQSDRLCELLHENMVLGSGEYIMNEILDSEIRPSKKLLEHAGAIIGGNKVYTLLDEQQVAYNAVRSAIRGRFKDPRKTVIIVKGGPGTGKSVIAMRLLADLASNDYKVLSATGSRAFREGLRQSVGNRAGKLFRYFNNFMTTPYNALDVLICDEAHRIRYTSTNRFTPRSERTNTPQVDELIRAAKVPVFLLDDKQVVKPDEIGSGDYIEEAAKRLECEIRVFDLRAQFRCNGSVEYVDWVDSMLSLSEEGQKKLSTSEYDFRILGSPKELDLLIRRRASEGELARMVAGFCWPWSAPKSDGTLVNDVVVDSWTRPWNAKSNAGRLAPGIPKEIRWAYEPGGMEQVGCIYTAQGFEFDYCGLIFGKDFVQRNSSWIFQKEYNKDRNLRGSDDLLPYVRDIYRVLLTRGMKGTYVYFQDRETEDFFKSMLISNGVS